MKLLFIEMRYTHRTEKNDDTILNTLLFTDDQVLLSHSADGVQRATYTLHNTKKIFGTKISPLKSKVMA
jgi:hypothetical protein